MRARDLMTSPTITCHVNDPLSVAAARMWDADIGVLPVVNDDGKVTGMITDRDICMAAYTQCRALDDLLVNLAMSKHVVSARPDAKLDEVERLMAKHQVHRIAIVDDAGKPLGIVSMTDIAIKHGPSTIGDTLAEICRSRAASQSAA